MLLNWLLDRLFGPGAPVPDDAIEDLAVYEDVVLRTLLTGHIHVANQRPDGSFEISEVVDD